MKGVLFMSNSILKFLGRNSCFGGHNTSAFIEDHNRLILIDCGTSVFYTLTEKFDLSKYETIDIIITHLHPDHAGSLGQLLMYLGYHLDKKANVVCVCQNIQTFLDSSGVDRDLYTMNLIPEVTFILTEHVKHLDSYGFKLAINGSSLVYTGDTSTLEHFMPYIDSGIDELYVDVSKDGGVHLRFLDCAETLASIKMSGVKVYLMHLDYEHEDYFSKSGLFDLAPLV